MMLKRIVIALGCILIASSAARSQEYTSTFATIGRQEECPKTQRLCDRIHDKFDRFPCCGYGKSHNEMGVPGFRGTKVFLWGSSCEFFVEPCRTPPTRHQLARERNAAQRMYDEMFGKGGSCSSCGQ